MANHFKRKCFNFRLVAREKGFFKAFKTLVIKAPKRSAQSQMLSIYTTSKIPQNDNMHGPARLAPAATWRKITQPSRYMTQWTDSISIAAQKTVKNLSYEKIAFFPKKMIFSLLFASLSIIFPISTQIIQVFEKLSNGQETIVKR